MSLLVILLLFNSVSCFIFRKLVHRGQMEIIYSVVQGYQSGVSILIAGLMNQPENAFSQLKNAKSGQMYYAHFSNYGWNAKNSARQLNNMEYPRATRINVFAISVGDKIAQQLTHCHHIYAINPCPHPSVLKCNQKSLAVVAVLLQVAVLILGWLAVIPIIPTEGGLYSSALFADQLYEIAVNRKTEPHNNGITSVIYSSGDEFLDNSKIREFYKNNQIEEITIEALHGMTSDPLQSKLYDVAIGQFERLA